MYFPIFLGYFILWRLCLVSSRPLKLTESLNKSQLDDIIANKDTVGRDKLDEMGKCCLLDMSCRDSGGCGSSTSLFTYYSPGLKLDIIERTNRVGDLKPILESLTIEDIIEIDLYLKSKRQKPSPTSDIVERLRNYSTGVGSSVTDSLKKPNYFINRVYPDCDLCNLISDSLPLLTGKELNDLNLPYSAIVDYFVENSSISTDIVESCVYMRNMNDTQLESFHFNNTILFSDIVADNEAAYTLSGCMNSESNHMDWFITGSSITYPEILQFRNIKSNIHQKLNVTKYMESGLVNPIIDFLVRQLKINPNGNMYVTLLLNSSIPINHLRKFLDVRTDDKLRNIALQKSKNDVDLMRSLAFQPSMWKLANEYFKIIDMNEIEKILNQWCDDWSAANVLNITLGFMKGNVTIGSFVNNRDYIPFHHRLIALKNVLTEQSNSFEGRQIISGRWKIYITDQFIKLAQTIDSNEFNSLKSNPEEFFNAFMFTGSFNPEIYHQIDQHTASMILGIACDICGLSSSPDCAKYHEHLKSMRTNIKVGKNFATGSESKKFTVDDVTHIISSKSIVKNIQFINDLGSFLVT